MPIPVGVVRFSGLSFAQVLREAISFVLISRIASKSRGSG